jgi:hypothetical protein
MRCFPPFSGTGPVCVSIVLFLVLFSGCGEYTIVVSQYDASRAYNGYTYFRPRPSGELICVDMTGEVIWNYLEPVNYFWGRNLDFEVLEEGTVLYMSAGRHKIIDPQDDTILWEDGPQGGHHTVELTPRGTILFLTNEYFDVDYEPWKPLDRLLGDVIKEIDMDTQEIVWEWRLWDYLDPIEHHDVTSVWTADWSHCNAVHFYPDYSYNGHVYDAVLLNSRHLDTFWMIDYATGEILWSWGEHGGIRADRGTGRTPVQLRARCRDARGQPFPPVRQRESSAETTELRPRVPRGSPGAEDIGSVVLDRSRVPDV